MNDLFFVDTNMLVYRRDLAVAGKQQRAEEWLRLLWKNGTGRLSVQVLHEFYAVVTRKLSPGLSPTEASEEIRDFFVWQPQPMTVELMEEAWHTEKRYKLSFWDSLIVSAAQFAGCRYLLTEDLQDGQALGQLRVVNPFRHDPQDFS